MAILRSSARKWIIAALLIVGIVAARPLWLRALGEFLVRSEQPVRADLAVVPAGDHYGYRILKAAELVRQGFTGVVLVSSPDGNYGYGEAELAIPFAVRHGYPASWFVALPNQAHSTREEAQDVALELRKRAVRKCLLVTSNFHTRRAGGLFRAAVPEVEFHVIAARDEFFRPGDWWKTRQGQKQCVLEWTKTLAGWFGI